MTFSCNQLLYFFEIPWMRSCVIDPRHLNNDGSTSFQRLKDLFVRDRPMFEVAALVFLTQPAPSVLRQLSECDELRARLFGTTEYVEAGETKAKNDPHVLILDQHCVQMSESVFALNNSVCYGVAKVHACMHSYSATAAELGRFSVDRVPLNLTESRRWFFPVMISLFSRCPCAGYSTSRKRSKQTQPR